MKNETTQKIIATIILALVILGSFTFGVDKSTDPATYEKTLSSLEEKKATVMTLTASSAIASTAIAAIPGDASTPIANKIADLSSSLLIILCAIYLEMALITLTGYASCGFLIPAACALMGIHIWLNRPQYKMLAQKMILFALVIMFVIPAGVKVGDIVYDTYDSQIQRSMSIMDENLEETADVITDEKAETATSTEKADSKTEEPDDGLKGWFSGIKDKVTDTATDVAEGIGNAVSSVGASVSQGVSQALDKGKVLLNCFIDSIAILIITSCLMPIAILMFFLWLTKAIFGLNIDTQSAYKKINRTRKSMSGKMVSTGTAAGAKMLKKSSGSKTKLLKKE
ncbi:MAG: hypothetical protein IKM61_02975 [Eubacteriaceae bacterium]|nr:hypothetical protein [Eubacteriaceae bacterium]